MSREAILKIRDAEGQAASIIADARERAQKMRDEAEREGLALCDAVEAETLTQKAEMMEQIRAKSEELAAATAQEAREEADEIIKAVRLRRKIAEKIIIRGLDTKCR